VWLSVSMYAMNNTMHTYKPYHRSLEIFSGSLLAKRREWQQVKEKLPSHTYLLVTPLTNSAPTRFMLNLGRSLRKAGVTVVVLSAG
jgi:hypothetical protein